IQFSASYLLATSGVQDQAHAPRRNSTVKPCNAAELMAKFLRGLLEHFRLTSGQSSGLLCGFCCRSRPLDPVTSRSSSAENAQAGLSVRTAIACSVIAAGLVLWAPVSAPQAAQPIATERSATKATRSSNAQLADPKIEQRVDKLLGQMTL